jgi:NAD+ diphosphatase
MYGGSPLNRLSWLRTSHHFLNAVISLPQSKWLLFNAGQPLVISNLNVPNARPVPGYLTTSEVLPFLGPHPYFGQGQEIGTLVPEEVNNMPHSPTEAARHHPQSVPIVFLGIHEEPADTDVSAALPGAVFSSPNSAVEAVKRLNGNPYFAMDVADLISAGQYTEQTLLDVLKEYHQGKEGEVFSWSEPRILMTGLDRFAAAIFASARSLVDWNYRNRFCAGCGSKAYSMWGGWKLSCSSLLPWAEDHGRRPCPSR